MNHLLFVDEDPNILKISRSYFEHHGFQVFTAETPEQALECVETNAVDCTVMNILPPGTEGLALCAYLKSKMNVPVIFLTSLSEHEVKHWGFAWVSGDFVTKPCDLNALEQRVRARIAQADKNAPPPETYDYPPLFIDANGRHVLINGKLVPLTSYEFDILLLLVRFPDKTFSLEAVYREIWKLPDLENALTVKVHVARMRQKLEKACPGRSFIGTVWKKGYQFQPYGLKKEEAIKTAACKVSI